MQKIPLSAQEMHIGLINPQKTNWLPYLVFAVIVIALFLLSNKQKRDERK